MSTTTKHNVQQFREQAEAYMRKHNCSWSEACLHVKKRHPEARAAFGAPPLKTESKE